jgi:hypothetical protein
LLAVPGFMVLRAEDGLKVTGLKQAVAEMEGQD